MAEAIVVGTDGSKTAKRAVAEAMRLARALDAELHVVSAYEPARAAAVAGAAEVSVRTADVPVKTHAVRGTPADALMSVADKVGASIIVVGNQGMHGAKRVLGSVPNSVSHKARCNVLIVATDPE